MAFPGRFSAAQRDTYAEHQRDALLLECEALLADDPTPFLGPLAELERQLVALLAPQSLNPADASNAVLALERAYADGVAELETAGHWRVGLSVFEFCHRLMRLEKRAAR